MRLFRDNPNKPYDIKEIITAVADNGDLETQQYFAQNIVTDLFVLMVNR